MPASCWIYPKLSGCITLPGNQDCRSKLCWVLWFIGTWQRISCIVDSVCVYINSCIYIYICIYIHTLYMQVKCTGSVECIQIFWISSTCMFQARKIMTSVYLTLFVLYASGHIMLFTIFFSYTRNYSHILDLYHGSSLDFMRMEIKLPRKYAENTLGRSITFLRNSRWPTSKTLADGKN